MRAPPTNSSSAMSSVYSIATDRSGSSAASTSSSADDDEKRHETLRQPSQSCRPSSRSASPPRRRRRSLPNSDGWNDAPTESGASRESSARCCSGRIEHRDHRRDREPHDRPRPLAKLLGVELCGDARRRRRPPATPVSCLMRKYALSRVLVHRDERARAVEHREPERGQHGAHEHQPARLRTHAPPFAHVGGRGRDARPADLLTVHAVSIRACGTPQRAA